MLIELDLDEAKSLKFTINQFLLIKLVLENIKAESYQNVIHVTAEDIEDLIKRKILTKESELVEGKLKGLKLTEEFESKFHIRNFFDEFYALYPISVTRTDGGKDYLRADVNRSRKSYESIVGKSTSKHEELMTALKHELQMRRAGNSMAYMKRMYKWLTSEEYKTYSESMLGDNNTELKDVKIYGTDVV